jgi:hypothetical protein
VTEAEWRDCTDPSKLAEQVLSCSRKLRLFACACCRRLPDNSRLLPLLTVAERFADGQATEQELVRARVAIPLAKKGGDQAAAYAAGPTTDLIWSMKYLLIHARDAHQRKPDKDAERRAQVELFHDIFGNHFRKVKANPAWSQWNGGLAVAMAEQIYEQRSFEDLPMLADALEEAGCEQRSLLDHFRGGGVHVPGCWALDVVLGKA